MVFQNYNIFKNKTVIENVMLPMTSVQKIEKEIAKEKALQYLDQVGLLDKLMNIRRDYQEDNSSE